MGNPQSKDSFCNGKVISPESKLLDMPDIHTDRISLVIRLAWEDRTSFEEIKERTGLAEREVIDIMRRELKASSFVLWRKRVGGRVTKHRKLLERRLKPSEHEGLE
jgi:uncharacterized protein (TIGR03643 family)